MYAIPAHVSAQDILTMFIADEDADRKVQAEVLLNVYSRDLERRRLAAGARGLLMSDSYGTSSVFTS